MSLNYYNRHIGDYAKDTNFLTLTQDGAYTRMLDLYYVKEKPLPLDRADLYRKLRANTKADREAVDVVLAEFFKEKPDGWHKGRCDEEIEKYQAKAEKNRENGAHGGRPKKPNGNPDSNPEITHMVSKQNPKITLASSQEPVTKNQEPTDSKSNPLKTLSGKPDGEREKTREKNATAVRIIAFLNAKAGKNFGTEKANVQLIVARLNEGATEQDFKSIIAMKAREWKGDPKSNLWLRPKTLFTPTNFAQYKGELGKDEPEDDDALPGM